MEDENNIMNDEMLDSSVLSGNVRKAFDELKAINAPVMTWVYSLGKDRNGFVISGELRSSEDKLFIDAYRERLGCEIRPDVLKILERYNMFWEWHEPAILGVVDGEETTAQYRWCAENKPKEKGGRRVNRGDRVKFEKRGEMKTGKVVRIGGQFDPIRGEAEELVDINGRWIISVRPDGVGIDDEDVELEISEVEVI